MRGRRAREALHARCGKTKHTPRTLPFSFLFSFLFCISLSATQLSAYLSFSRPGLLVCVVRSTNETKPMTAPLVAMRLAELASVLVLGAVTVEEEIRLDDVCREVHSGEAGDIRNTLSRKSGQSDLVSMCGITNSRLA